MTAARDIAQLAAAGAEIRRAEALSLATSARFDELLLHANRLRERAFGETVHLCAIVNAKSGACAEDCKFCAQSARHRTVAEVYPLVGTERILAAARGAAANRAACFSIVTSGESTARNRRDFDIICSAVRDIAASRGIRPAVSIGSLSRADAERLEAAGVRRIHHNLETSERFFPNVCTTHSWADRRETIENVKAAGLEVCCGGLFGMGETWADRVDLALALRRLDVDSVPINFLNPVPGTPFAGRPLLEPREALRIVALFRFILPTKEISVCGGRNVTLRDLQSWMFHAGASGTMIGNYLTTKGRSVEDDLRMLADLGLRAREPKS